MGPKKRKADEAKASTQFDALDWMKDVLECPVCLEVMKDPPIYICENPQGHSLCSKCHESLLKAKIPCPVCRQPMGNRRSLGLEGMVNKLPKVKCRFDGCEYKRSDEAAVKKHEDDCENRYVPCAYCDDAVGMKKLAAHIIGKHGKKPLQYQKTQKRFAGSIPLNCSPQSVVKSTVVDEQNPDFLFNCSKKNECKLFWISLIGSKNSAKTFKYTFTLWKDKDKSEKLVEISRYVLACDISHEQVKNQLSAVIFDKELIDEAKEEGTDLFYYDLVIRKL